jgi:hypothetical protein
MKVIVTARNLAEWQELTENTATTIVTTFQMATAPDQQSTACVFHIDDDTAAATWIQLQHPDWIEWSWIAQYPDAVVTTGPPDDEDLWEEFGE